MLNRVVCSFFSFFFVTSLVPHINYSPKHYSKYVGWSMAGAAIKTGFAIESLFAEKQLVLARKKWLKQFEQAGDNKKQQALALKQYRAAQKVYEPQIKMTRMLAGLAGAAEHGCAVRNNLAEKITLGSIAVGQPFVGVSKNRIGRFLVLRSLLTIIDGMLGLVRAISYKGVAQMRALTVAQRVVQLTNMMLTHGFKRLSPGKIGLYVVQAAAITLSFVGSPRENKLANFDWQGNLQGEVDLIKQKGVQESFAALSEQLFDPSISPTRCARGCKEVAVFGVKVIKVIEQMNAQRRAMLMPVAPTSASAAAHFSRLARRSKGHKAYQGRCRDWANLYD